ncbi:MAG: PglB [Clostridiales bacterium]|nr:PglB [Clostridiales bacterium]
MAKRTEIYILVDGIMTTNDNLLILGAGQYGQVAKEIAESTGLFGKIDFLDDNVENVVGSVADYEKLAGKYSYAFVAIGNADLRLAYIRALEKSCFRIAVLISPKAYVSQSAQIKQGSIVEPFAIVNSNSAVGEGTLICAGAIVNHNAVVGDACHLDCGSVVEANAVVPDKIKLGCNEVFSREGKILS